MHLFTSKLEDQINKVETNFKKHNEGKNQHFDVNRIEFGVNNDEMKVENERMYNLIDYENVSKKLLCNNVNYSIEFRFSNESLIKLAESFIYLPSLASYAINNGKKFENLQLMLEKEQR